MSDPESSLSPQTQAGARDRPSDVELSAMDAHRALQDAISGDNDDNGDKTSTPTASTTLIPSRPAPLSPQDSSDALNREAAAADAKAGSADDEKPPPAPHRLQPTSPRKGILKPPPPPAKPGLFGGKLRDALGSIHPRFFDYQLGVGSADDASREMPMNGIANGGLEQVGNLASGVIGGVGAVGEAVGGATLGLVGNWGSKLGKMVAGQPEATTSSVGPVESSNESRVTSGFARFRQQAASTINAAAQAAQKPPPNRPVEKPLPASPEAATATPVKLTFASPSSPFSLHEPKSSSRPLKRASFLLPAMSVTYPISASTPPWSDKVTSDRQLIDAKAAESWSQCKGAEHWTRERLVALYESACRGREEPVRMGVRYAVAAAAPPMRKGLAGPRYLLLTGDTTLPLSAITPNEQIDSPPDKPFRCDAPLGKHAAESLADVLSLEWGLSKLTLEGGILAGDDALKPILHALTLSGTLPYLSLAGNKRLKPAGWRMVSVYLRKAHSLRYLDVSDNILDKRSIEHLMSAFVVTAGEDEEGSKAEPVLVQTLKMDGCNLRAASLEHLGQSIRRSQVKNLSLRRNKINSLGAVAVAVMLRDYPDSSISQDRLSPALRQLATSAANGDVVPGHFSPPPTPDASDDKLGPLVTLDVRGNDMRGGVAYIAQVLKRNRTLKVLNLSDNKIDASGMIALAEALRHNTTLETLDLSLNPCASLEAVIALRATLVSNRSLKRIFLANTGLGPEGAIALAEGIPEMTSILHLDLTENAIAEAGLMALGAAAKTNSTLRCIDVSVDLSHTRQVDQAREILQTCIANAEAACRARQLSQAAQDAIWQPLRKSTIFRQAREAEEAKVMEEVRKAADTPAGLARNAVYAMKPDVVLRTCSESIEQLQLAAGSEASDREKTLVEVERAKALLDRIADMVQDTEDAERLERMLALNDLLTPLIAEVTTALTAVPQRRRPLSSDLQTVFGDRLDTTPSRRHLRAASLELTSPNFSIADSDDDSDAEELAPAPRSYPSRIETPLKLDTAATSSSTPEGSTSPLERANKDWLAEEGEIFRKGQKLGVAEEEDDEDGSELKQRILETHVERTPHQVEDASL